MNVIWQDVRYALRSLRRDRGFTAMLILILGIGIGLNTAVFSVVRSVLLQPLPYPEPDRLVMIWSGLPEQGVEDATSAYSNLQALKEQTRSFDDLATYDPITLTVTDGDWPERASGVKASANIFSVLGKAPALGRAFSLEEEQQRMPVVVLSHDFWQRWFDGSPDAIGRTLGIAGIPFEVIGVMPESFAFPERTSQLWLPQTLFSDWEAVLAQRGTGPWFTVGRLTAQATLPGAREELRLVASRLRQMDPEANAGLQIGVVAVQDYITGKSFRLTLWTLFGAVGLVLLIACANASHMLLARGTNRAHEFALRISLGASAARLFRQVLTESMVIAVCAGIMGTVLAVVGLDLLVSLAPANTPRLDEIVIDTMMLVYAIGISVVVGILFGIMPALGFSSTRLYETLRAGSNPSPRGRKQSVRAILTMLQFALAIILVFGASLLVQSLSRASAVNPGFQQENVLMANLSVESAANRVAFYEQVIEQVRSIPGVAATGIVEDLFISGAPNRLITVQRGESMERAASPLRIDAIAGGFFETLGVSIREGRGFSSTDQADAPPVAVVNEAMARRFWPGESPVGKRFRTRDSESDGPWIEVIGLVADMHRQGPEHAPIPQAFRPYVQDPSRNMVLLVRTHEPVPGLASVIRTRIAEVDRTVPLYMITTVGDVFGGYLSQRRFQTVMLGLFSTIALVLAAIGIYGLIQYSVSQRTREIGVRVALGGTSGRVVAMILRQGFSLALPGMAVGIATALLISRYLSSLFFDVTASDLASLLVTSATLLLTTFVACYIPARRAATIDPVTALRNS